MSDLAIHLLGRPRVERGGAAVPAPRGHKAWGVLAYLLLADRPPSRDELASLLFARPTIPRRRCAGTSARCAACSATSASTATRSR